MVELQLRGELHVDAVAQAATQELGVAVQRRDHDRGFLVAQPAGAQRLDIHLSLAQVGRHAHLGDGDRYAGHVRVLQFLGAQHFHQSMADQFARAQLALRRTFQDLETARLWSVFHGSVPSLAVARTQIEGQ